MANPQPIPFVQLSAELADAIARFPFGPIELRCLLAVVRFTYGGLKMDGQQGPNRKTAMLSYGDVARYLNCDRGKVYKAMTRLVEKRVLRRHKTSAASYSWGVQKDYDRWRKCSLSGDTSVDPEGTPCSLSGDTSVDPEGTPLPVDSEATVQGQSSSDQSNSTGVQSVPSEATPILHKEHTTDKDADAVAARPRSFSELTSEWKERLQPLIDKFNAVPDFNPYAWVGLALQGKCGNGGRHFEPETIARVLEVVTPPDSAKAAYKILNSYLNSTQEMVEHERRKRESREADTGLGDFLGKVPKV